MEYTINCSFTKHYDVIVAGAGPAGVAAAISAARQGAKTLIIEQQGRLGGISTSGLMSHFTGTVGNRLYHEILERASQKNHFEKGLKTTRIDPEMLTLTYIELLEEAGAEILLYTSVVDVIKDGNTLKGVVSWSKGGFSCFCADVVIDATGDGDVAYRAGAAFIRGRESDGRMQPATLMFKVGGVDPERAVLPPSFETLVPTEKGELQALAKKLLPDPAGHVLLYRSTIPGIVTVNMTNAVDIDGTRAEDLTRAEIVCRKQIEPIVTFLREYAPGYESCYVISCASLIGIRETRHFKGIEVLTEEDIANAVQHDDCVVYDAHFNFDVHNITGSGLDKTGCQAKFTQKKGYTIPYGCLVPEKTDGLLLAGRSISGTHMAHLSFRAMPICVGMGEAAGIAAAIAAKQGLRPREVNVRDIQALLR